MRLLFACEDGLFAAWFQSSLSVSSLFGGFFFNVYWLRDIRYICLDFLFSERRDRFGIVATLSVSQDWDDSQKMVHHKFS